MPRIKIDDLPILEEMSPEQAKGIFGGSTNKDEEPSEGIWGTAGTAKDDDGGRSGDDGTFIEDGKIDIGLG
jgi:hypothetical protein